MTQATPFDGRTEQQRYDDLMEIMRALPFLDAFDRGDRVAYTGPERRTGPRRYR